MARSRFRGTCTLILAAAGLMYAATQLMGDSALPDAVVKQIEAGKAAEAALRKVKEDLSELKGQLSDAEKERENQQSLLERNTKLVSELQAAKDRADAAAKLAVEKTAEIKKEKERLEEESKRLTKEKEAAEKRAAEAAAAAKAKEASDAVEASKAKADAERAAAAVSQAKAEADAAAQHAADAAKRLHEAERAAAGHQAEAQKATEAVARAPAAAVAVAPNGKKPIPTGIVDVSQVPGRACCPGEAMDMSEYDMTGTAYVTLATGNDAARGVIVLVQSLRDVGTRVDKIIVMLSRGGMGSPECRGEDGGAWKRANKREHIHHCGGPDTVAEEIVSPVFVETLKRIGATVVVVDEIPSTPFTEGIPGGRATFWGMALNKLRVYNMTGFRKVIWMDGDTMALKNIDHLFLQPMFTGAFTHACCNARAPAIPSGGLWVVEPSSKLWNEFWKMMAEGKPKLDGGWGKETIITGADGKFQREYWHWGDMQIVRWYFSRWTLVFDREPLWPELHDDRHGSVAGLEHFPAYRGKSSAEMVSERKDSYGRVIEEGFKASSLIGPNQFGDQAPVWRALDARFDQCVGNCDCIPERDMPDVSYTVHFSCIQGVNKPGGYATEKEFGEAMMNTAPSCTRHWFWHIWYDKLKRAHGRLPDPYTGPEIPGYDRAHDQKMRARLLAAGSTR